MSVHREKVSKDKQGFIEKGKGVRKGEGLGLKSPLSLIFYKNFITCAKDINCFRILFAC